MKNSVRLVSQNKKLPTVHSVSTSSFESLEIERLFANLPLAHRALLETYFLIPQPSARRFVLLLMARITGDLYTTSLFGDLSEAEYLLTQYTRLPNEDMRKKMLALVRQVAAVNRGDLAGQQEEP